MKLLVEWLYRPLGLATAVVTLFLSATSGDAAVVTVNVGDNFFNPPVSRINVNDSVRWVWGVLQSHTSTHTGSPPLWDSGLRAPSSPPFTNTFRFAGSFPYRCTVPAHVNQTGTVVVTSTNLPPNVILTFPTNTATFAAPATIKLIAQASDAEGTVTNVQFRRSAVILTNDTTNPYEFTDSNVAAATYSYAAIASDNVGDTFTNRVTVFVVNAVPVVLTNLLRTAPNQFQFRYSANVNLHYVIEKSPDLTQWQPIATNRAVSALPTFTDNDASGGQSFYRVGRLPNPEP
jgi:plastocyanin